MKKNQNDANVEDANAEDVYSIPDDVRKRLSHEAIQLPLWPDLTRAMPNHIARSSLFSPIKRGKRQIYDRERLASREDVEIYYTGKQLDMADQDVFLQVLNVFRETDLNTMYISINRSDILKAIKRNTGKKDYLWLDESIHRLKSGTLTIKSDRYKTELSLVGEWTRDDITGQVKIAISPKIKMLFSNNEFGYINWPRRMALENKVDLSKWLQTYFSANGKGKQRHRFDTIKNLCGAKTRLNDFRQDIEEALKELVRVGEITDLRIDKEGFALYKPTG